MAQTRILKPQNRAGIWYLMRRVPTEFAQLDKRNPVRISTEIAVVDDPRGIRAREVILHINSQLEVYWKGLRDGQSAEQRIRFDAAQARARALGLTYKPASDMTDVDEILRRVAVLVREQALDEPTQTAAILGGEPVPRIMVSELVKEYEEIQQTALRAKSPKQLHKWRLPKLRAMNNFLDVLKEDRALIDLTREDAIKFRLWWESRIVKESLDIDTANKDLGHISIMMGTIDLYKQLGIQPIFARLRIPGSKTKQRAAFTTEWLQTKIFAEGAMTALNAQARHIALLVPLLGMRPSEVANLRPESILLDAPIPHVKITPIERELKTDASIRDIPLVGSALAIMRKNPVGFPRYRDNEDSLSALVNDYLDTHGLLPTAKHSLYSGRHNFEDRLTDVEAPEKLVATLMGHKWHRPKYGAGPTLEQKARWLALIDITLPEHF